MLFNLEQGPIPSQRKYDVCIAGAGPAGISLALSIARARHSVLLLEAGDLEPTESSREHYRGTIVGTPYFPLDTTRVRCLGGSSGHWTGWCRGLDDVDFERKSYLSYSGWPIARRDLDEYAAESAAILDVPIGEGLPPSKPIEGSAFEEEQFLFSVPPTRFSEKYRAELTASRNLHLVLNANLVDIILNPELRGVSSFAVRNYSSSARLAVSARYFVLCLGGLENPRALLNANSQTALGIGNRNDLVGRFFADHLHVNVGSYVSRAPIQSRRFLAPTRQFIHQAQILNAGLRIEPSYASGTEGMLKGMVCGSSILTRVAETLRGGRKLNCVGPGEVFEGQIRVAGEPALDPASRVKLGEERDTFGLRRIELDWRISDIDLETIRTVTVRYGQELASADAGRLRVAEWLLSRRPSLPTLGEDELAGHHHMCTTRMSDDDRTGVVDRNCKVFGIDNLYVGGSSVFGSAGHANPTLTIVQLALRLADHLKGRMASARA